MTAEFSLYGVFLSGAFVTAMLAFVVLLAARRILMRVGFYDLVWHRHLVDVALFTILWAGVVASLPHILSLWKSS